MVAWNNFGNGETPESSGLKGDQLVGKYYVLFEKKFNEQVHSLQNEGHDKESAAQNAPIMIQAREMLKKWEKNLIIIFFVIHELFKGNQTHC